MPIQIGAKGATIGGINYPPHTYVDWLSPAQEALAKQGGDAFDVPARGLSAAEAAYARFVARGGILQRGLSYPAAYQLAMGPNAVVTQTPTAVAWAANVVWRDLKRPRGAVLDTAAYARGTVTLNHGAGLEGVLYPGDEILIGGQLNTNIVRVGTSNLGATGNFTLADYGLAAAIAGGTPLSITLIRRGLFMRLSANCKSDAEGLRGCQHEYLRDASVRLGEDVTLLSPVPFTQLHGSPSGSVLDNNTRLVTIFGEA